jgi:hypothetical protein
MTEHMDHFSVLGRHSWLYPVDLPEWLPVELVNKMLNTFKAFLVKEFQSLLKAESKAANVERGHKSTVSTDSTGSGKSGMTMSSSHSDPHIPSRVGWTRGISARIKNPFGFQLPFQK